MGGTKDIKLVEITKDIWDYLITKGIMITAEYLPSAMNIIADKESRQIIDSSEWMLDPKIFQQICLEMGSPRLDLSASRTSHQLPLYFAWRPDPFSQGTDAMQQNWGRTFLYALPPFCLISRVLQKIIKDQTEKVILITPTWHTQPWYPQLLRMLSGKPVLLPKQNNLLKNPLGNSHPLMIKGSLRLAAWKISGKDYVCQEYQKQLPHLSQNAGEMVQRGIMSRPGVSGLAGVIKNKLIQFHVM